MSTNANGKRDRDDVVVAALASGLTYDEAAKAAGLSRSTIARRMQEWEFRARVIEERERVVETVRGKLASTSPAAVEVIASLAASADSEAVRLSAAGRILDYSLRRRAGFDTFDVAEVGAIVRELVEASLSYIPEETHGIYLRQVSTIGRAAK
jgi:hypothetical protein